MAHDREMLRTIWETQVALRIQADPNEVVGLQQPEDFYLIVSRLSYLPLVTDKVKKYFSGYIANDQQDGTVWFDYNGTPLKLHYPIGVLQDLLRNEDELCPWLLTIHFSKFPEHELIKFDTKDLLESFYMSCLKEADVLKHRGQVISVMQKKDHNQLWTGLLNDKFDQFWAINRRLMECIGDGGIDTFKHIPLRFYNEYSTAFEQRLITPVSTTGQKKTVNDLLMEISTPSLKAVAIKTHGINVHSDTQLQWMSEHLSYPDNFLHLLVTYEKIKKGNNSAAPEPNAAD